MAIQTSHVGSLPRSQKVVDYIFAREKGEDYNEIEFDQVMTEAVNDTVRKQKKAGITIVSDGETSKISYATYVKARYHGVAGDSPRNATPRQTSCERTEKDFVFFSDASLSDFAGARGSSGGRGWR